MMLIRRSEIPVIILWRPLRPCRIYLAAVVTLALLRIAQKVVSPGYLLELLFGFFVAWIEIRVKLLCQFTVCLLNISRRRSVGDAQNFIWVFHCLLRASLSQLTIGKFATKRSTALRKIDSIRH